MYLSLLPCNQRHPEIQSEMQRCNQRDAEMQSEIHYIGLEQQSDQLRLNPYFKWFYMILTDKSDINLKLIKF